MAGPMGATIIPTPSRCGWRAAVHDLHATMLKLMGFDLTRLTFKFQGRNFQLTDVSGEVLESFIA
jgi:hypothetical protein